MAGETDLSKLPRPCDMSKFFKNWFTYRNPRQSDGLHHSGRHDDVDYSEIQELTLKHECLMVSEDLFADSQSRKFKCGGFDAIWDYVLPRIDQQAKAFRYIKDNYNGELPMYISTAKLDDRIVKALDCACFYEIIPEHKTGYTMRPCHLAFDIEVYHAENPNYDFDRALDALLNAVDVTFEQYYGLKGMRKQWKAVKSFSSNNKKISCHLTMRLPFNLMFAGWMHVGAFCRRVVIVAIKLYGHPEDNVMFINVPKVKLKQPLPDGSVFSRWRSFRPNFMAKKGSRRPQFPVMTYYEDGVLKEKIGSFEDVSKETFLQGFIQGPPDDPTQVRILYCNEPDESPAGPNLTMPFYWNDEYCIDIGEIGNGGSLPRQWSGKMATDSFQRLLNASTEHMMLSKYVKMNEHSALSLISDKHNTYSDQKERDIAKFCVELGNMIASNLEQKDVVLSYSHNTVSHTMMFQMASRWCPMQKRHHTSNHISYIMNLCPNEDDTAMPTLSARCFHCTPKGSDPIRQTYVWWDAKWDTKRHEYMTLAMEIDKITLDEVFGWLY